jgi:Skp family chaperone for outer membrane proteins
LRERFAKGFSLGTSSNLGVAISVKKIPLTLVFAAILIGLLIFRPEPSPAPSSAPTSKPEPARIQKLKIATIDIKKLTQEYWVYKQAIEEKERELEAIRQDDDARKKIIETKAEELKKLAKIARDPSLGFADRDEARKETRSKEADLQALIQERVVFIEKSRDDLLTKMEAIQKEIGQDISDRVNQYATKQEFDLVFDSTGVSRSEFPFLIYDRDATDLTEGFLKILNKDAPELQENDQSIDKEGS